MKRTHPPTLLRLVERALGGPCGVRPGASLAVAVSGGPDSMGLLHALAALRERLGFSLLALSIDHGLRPESLEEVALVEATCLAWQVPFRTSRLELSPGPNLQARAREARYAALWKLASEQDPNCLLATAHHADDRAETVLLRLIRGTSPAGLDVLKEREGKLLRPMIRARKSTVLTHNERHVVPSVSDPSNLSSRFLRVRVRTELLPLLVTFNPQIVENLCALADEAAGEPLGLGREHRRQLRAALDNPRLPIDLRLGQGLRLRREP